MKEKLRARTKKKGGGGTERKGLAPAQAGPSVQKTIARVPSM
jgi:hypothetical protein